MSASQPTPDTGRCSDAPPQFGALPEFEPEEPTVHGHCPSWAVRDLPGVVHALAAQQEGLPLHVGDRPPGDEKPAAPMVGVRTDR